MYWSGYIEKVGTGTEDIINQCKQYGLKTPEFQQDEDFKVIIWRSSANLSDPDVIQTDPDAIQTDPDRLIVILRKNPSISRTKLSKELGISERKVRNIMNDLRSSGYLIREGSDSHGQWVLNEPTEEYNKK